MGAKPIITLARKKLSKYLKKQTDYTKKKTNPETTTYIRRIISNADDIKKQKVGIASLTPDKTRRKSALKIVRNALPEFYKYLGGKDLAKKQRQISTSRPSITTRIETRSNKAQEYLKKTITDINKGTGDFKKYINKNARENLGLKETTFAREKRKYFSDPKTPKLSAEKQQLMQYFDKFITSQRYDPKKRYTAKVVQNLEAKKSKRFRHNTPEEMFLNFLYRSQGKRGSNVVLLKDADRLKNMVFKIGGKRIDFDTVKKGMQNREPLYQEVKDAFDLKKATLSQRVYNPARKRMTSLNEASYDVLGKDLGNQLFHISHQYGVGQNPTDFLQIMFGPYNRQLDTYLRANKLKGGLQNFLVNAKKKNIGNPFEPEFAKKSPAELAQEGEAMLVKFYKMGIKDDIKKSEAFYKMGRFKKGGIACLKN